jgi:hypothetical protein
MDGSVHCRGLRDPPEWSAMLSKWNGMENSQGLQKLSCNNIILPGLPNVMVSDRGKHPDVLNLRPSSSVQDLRVPFGGNVESMLAENSKLATLHAILQRKGLLKDLIQQQPNHSTSHRQRMMSKLCSDMGEPNGRNSNQFEPIFEFEREFEPNRRNLNLSPTEGICLIQKLITHPHILVLSATIHAFRHEGTCSCNSN